MQPCNRRFDRLITIDCMLLNRICRRTPKPFVPNVFTEQAYVFNSGIQYQEWNPAHVSLEFCWHCCRRTLNVFVFTSRMKSSIFFLGIMLALLQKHAWRVCLYIKNAIQDMLSLNFVGIVAEKRLTCLSLYQEWNPAHAFLEFCWHCCRKTLDVFVFISRIKSSKCSLLQKNAWRVDRQWLTI